MATPDPTAVDPRTSADPLGDALHNLRIAGTFYCRSELTAPWGLTLPPMPGCLWFHVVTSGGCQLDVDGTEPRQLQVGELALVPHGRGHRLYGEPGADAPTVLDLPHEFASDRYAILRHGGGGHVTVLVCGAVRLDHPAGRNLAELLPSVIHLQALSSPHANWMQATLALIAAEATELRPGGETVLTRLSDILVIQAIRSWIDSDPAARTGWLGALHDPQIGRAISLMHHYPARPWTLATLANEVAMSRSAFAARFTELAGESPMSYLTRWRMHLALDWLKYDNAAVGELAGRLGYQSEAAFSRAFKRVTGLSPGAARHHGHLPGRHPQG